MTREQADERYFKDISPETYGFYFNFIERDAKGTLQITLHNNGMELALNEQHKKDKWIAGLRHFYQDMIGRHIQRDGTITEG